MKTISWLHSNFLIFLRKKRSAFAIRKQLMLVGLLALNLSVFSQSYVGNNLTSNGVTITPGYLFNNNGFVESEAVINGTNNFVFSKYSLCVGKQFLITGNNGDEDRCIKIKTSLGATLSKYETVFIDANYKSETNTYKLCENNYKTSNIKMNYRVELIWHNKPFDYFLLSGYNNGFYSGIGWRGFFKKK
jgi:hypothetical protein